MDIVDYALKFLGRTYIWGGDGSGKSFGGFDCSGLALECLWASGQFKGSDCTSQGLYKALLKLGWVNVRPGEENAGDLCFWGKSSAKITHVSIVSEPGFHVEAGGGSSKCTKPETSTGMVRVRPLTSRNDLLAILRKP